MKVTKIELLRVHERAYEVLSYLDLKTSISINTVLIEDVSLEIINPAEYPFKLSFDELLCSMDEIFEEKDIEEIYAELGEDFVTRYVDYVNDYLYPRYQKLLGYISKNSIF